MTQTLKVDATTPEPELILEAARVIRRGGLVAFPTETVYGLGANGLEATAVRRIFEAKRRPSSDPLILHLEHAGDLKRVAVLDGLEGIVSRLAARFMPGALTLVLPKAENVPLEVTAGGSSVAVRVPAHAVARALITASGVPIAAPSANLFSRPSPTTAASVLEDLDGRIDVVLDGGETHIGVESTVLSLLGAPTLLRPGGVSLEDLEAEIGEVVLPGEVALEERTAQPAPGMLLKHYSPRAKLWLLEFGADLESRLKAQATQARGERLGLLLPTSSLEWLSDLEAVRFDLGDSLSSTASRLFTGMRALDSAGCTVILTHRFAPKGLGRALNDRLFRAASGNVIRAI
jgi:L-threonylcarbamoyladenylate synthase